MTDKEFKAIKKKQDEKANEIWKTTKPSAKLCKTCVYAFPNTEYTIGAEKANCEIFMPPDDKPADILWDEGNCEFYEEKEEE